MKVAFATDDKITISRMTGRAKLFAVYSIEDGEVKNIEYISNDHEHNHDHGHENEGNHSHDHSHSHNHNHNHNHSVHNHGNNAGDGMGIGKGRNSHSGHSHKKVLFELADRNALFITRHLGKHFKEGVIELGIDYKMTKIEKIEDALKEL